MRKPIAVLVLCLVPFFALPSWAAQIYVEQATGSGSSSGDQDTATSLVRTSAGSIGNNHTLDSPDGADFTLRPKLMKLGKAYILNVSKVQNGQVIYASQLKAANMDELDKVALRVTQAVLSGRQTTDDAQVGEITNQESKDGTQRRPVRHETYVGIGAASLANMNAQHLGYSLGVATAWDTNTFLVRLMGELSGAGSAGMLSGGIGLNYFILNSDAAPYIGADFGYGAAKADGGGFFSGATRGGFVFGLDAGVVLLRTSTINLDLGFRAGFLANTNDYGRPASYSLRVGLYF